METEGTRRPAISPTPGMNGKVDFDRNEDESKFELVGEIKDEKSVSFRQKLRNPEYKEKFTYSMFMAVSFVALGMNVGQHGPTFMDLQIITNTDLETASALFTGGNAGYLVGSIIIGFLYNKVNTSMLVFVMTLCLGITNILLPYCTQIELMIATRFAYSMFGAAIGTGLNSEHMMLWESDANGLLQLLHFSFSFGGVISPLFTEPFLAEKIDLQTTNISTNESVHNNASTTLQEFTESRVEYVFLITGIFTIVTAFPFLIVYFKRSDYSKNTANNRKFSQRYIPFSIQILMVSSLGLFYFFYGCLEETFFSFLMTFLVEEYDSVSKSKGAFVTALAWAAFAVARFLMIFMTKMFTTVQLILILTTAMVIYFTSFSVFAHFGIVNALIVISAIAPLGFSGVFPAGLSWTEKEMFPVTGIISACVFVSGSLGSMVNPLILGYLMEEHTNMWFCYLLLILTCVVYFLFIGMLVFCRYFVDIKYGSLSSHLEKVREMEIVVTSELHPEAPEHNDI